MKDNPRLEPITLETADEEQRALLEPMARDGRVLNVFGTLARKPDAARSYLAWGSYCLRRSAFDQALKEMAILRVGFLCRSSYEWAQHRGLARQAGVSDREIERIKVGPDADGWSEDQAMVLRAADEAVRQFKVGDATWSALATRFGDESAADLVYVIGHYIQTSLFLNSFGVALEPGQEVEPEFE